MTSFLPLSTLEVTNQCVVVCNLYKWSGPESAAWQVVWGSQDEVGRDIAAVLNASGVRRMEDFGCVCKSFLCEGDQYKQAPPLIKGKVAVFSLTPKNRIGIEGQEMASVSKAAKYMVLIMTVQKDGKFGKVWVLRSILRYQTTGTIIYYEDTDSIIDELKESPEGNKVYAIHVQVPGYESYIARLADRVVSQSEYQREVLE